MGDFTPGVCTPWISVDDFLSSCGSVDESTPVSQIEDAIDIASNSLYLMSGSQFRGLCTRTVLVCNEHCLNTRKTLVCSFENEIDLGFWPLSSITSVKFDGVSQDLSNFQINDYRYIEKKDGLWPTQLRNNLVNVEITFIYGVKPPTAGVEAAKVLAEQILNAMMKKSCSLPDRASHVVRQGVTIDIADYDLLAKDFLGIYMVDLFLQAVNPCKARIQSFVMQPGRMARTRRKNT